MKPRTNVTQNFNPVQSRVNHSIVGNFAQHKAGLNFALGLD